MYTLKLDSDTNDLMFDGQNNLSLVSDENEENQSLRAILSTNKGEWFLNSDIGIDYTLLQVKNPDLDLIKQEIYSAIMQEGRVSSVDSLEVSFDSSKRKLSISFSATMVSGNIIIANEVISA